MTKATPRSVLWLQAAVLAGLVLSDPASAQRRGTERTRADEIAEEEARKAREAREQRVPQVVEEAEREKVEVTEEPTLRYEDFRREVEIKVSAKRKEMLDYLEQILEQTTDEKERPSLLFQKAELYLEESQFHFFQGMGLDDKIAEALSNGDDKTVVKLQQEKERELKESKQWVRDAVLLFQEIEQKYPDFERMPDVLFALGRAFWDVGSFKKALEAYRKLIRNFPKNQYAADAWLAFGEYYFQLAPEGERDVNKALNAYIEASKFQDSPVFGYAVYKQGWCYYNLVRHEKAAEKFKEVILYSQINSDLLGERRIPLAREARKDYVLAFSHYGSAKEAPTEFKSVAEGEEFRKMLERLGDIYYGEGKDRDAIIIYQLLMKMDPDSSKNPLFQGKIVKLASRIGEKRQVVGQVRRLVEEFKKARERFAKMSPSDPNYEIVKNDLDEAERLSDNTLRYLATTWHNEAKKTRQQSTYEYAYELYGDYLALFPDRKEAYEIRFFYAELLYKLEKFELAGEQYLKVFQIDPKGKWARAAAEEAVRAFDEVVKDYNRQNKAPPPTGPDALKERPIPEVKKKYIAACNNYVKHYPDGGIAVEARYKIARTLYDYNYFKDSTPRFMEIVEKYPDYPRAEQAANLVLDTYNLLEDWQALHDAARTFSQSRSLMRNAEFKEIVLSVLEESAFKLVGEFEKKQLWEEAGKRYLAFADEFNKSKLADKALANAAAMFTKAGQLDRAIKVRIRLVKTYEASPLVPDQLYHIATSYEQVVAYEQAAEWLERFVEKAPDDPRAKDALFNASIYRQGVGRTKKAIADRELYLKRYPKAPDAEDVAFSIPTTWEEAGNTRRAIDAYLEFAKTWQRRAPARALEAQYRAVRLMEGQRRYRREFDQQLAVLEQMARRFRKNPTEDVADPLAYLAFRDADRVFDNFKRLEIAKPDKPADFRRTLKAKTEGKEKVYAAYTDVVKLKSPEWAVASLYRIGEAHAHLASAIQDVPPPKLFNEVQAQMFRDQLAEQTLPIEEQASQAMMLCLDKSAELGVFNEWTKRCLTYLEEKRPEQFPRASLEQRPPLELKVRPADPGKGFVLELPKPGDRARPDPGTELPPPPVEGDAVSMRAGPGGAG